MAWNEASGAQAACRDTGAARAGVARARKTLSREGALLGGCALILAGAFAYPYLEGLLERAAPGCLFHRLTGLPCLLCGMTRSLAATAHGRLTEAFRFHLLGPLLFVLLLALTVLLAAEYALARPILPRPGRKGWRILSWGTLGLLVAAWVARLALFGVDL